MDQQREAFTSASQLTTWLHTHGIDTTTWGQAAAKRVDDLWQELVDGESTLQVDPPVRCVGVVEVFIESEGRRLLEWSQQLADGRVRERKRPPSEKMKPGEAPLAAAQRCLGEELTIDRAQITLVDMPITERTLLDESGSYPGLQTLYTFYKVHLQVAGLPQHAFTTTNVAHGEGDPVVAHHWVWVPVIE